MYEISDILRAVFEVAAKLVSNLVSTAGVAKGASLSLETHNLSDHVSRNKCELYYLRGTGRNCKKSSYTNPC